MDYRSATRKDGNKGWLDKFSKNLRNKMDERGLNQKALSGLSGICKGDISRYVNGLQMPNAKTLAELAKALRCSSGALIDYI